VFDNLNGMNAKAREYQRRLRANAKALGLTKRAYLRQVRGTEDVGH
jgi:hypothetical protein